MTSFENPYQGVEAPTNFHSSIALKEYRAHVLTKTQRQAAFIAKRIGEASSVREACCGNGRLLIALSDRVERLEGFDLAKSRIAFAQSWIDDLTLRNISVWEDDVLNPSSRVAGSKADCLICITGAFGYFEALGEGNGQRVRESFYNGLYPGGHLFLELYPHPLVVSRCRDAKDNMYRTWMELPESDPFLYYLSEYHLEESRSILTHKKIFVGRGGEIDSGREERLRIYGVEEILDLLSPEFEDIALFGNWTGSNYCDGVDESMIVVARRKPVQ